MTVIFLVLLAAAVAAGVPLYRLWRGTPRSNADFALF
jgi:hypothetical protein